MSDIYQVLNDLQIHYEKYDHPAVHTVEEAALHYRGLDAGSCKNLFLRNAKGDQHYLVVMEGEKRLDLKKLSQTLGNKLSFASSERLMEYLGLTPGSVSPFGLINNTDKSVRVIVDNELLKFEKVGFHPNINTSTLILSTNDLKKFLAWAGNPVIYLDLS